MAVHVNKSNKFMSIQEYELETDGLLFGETFVRFEEMNKNQFKAAYQAIRQRSAHFEKESDEQKSRANGWRLAFCSLLVMIVFFWIAVPHRSIDPNTLDVPTTVAE